MPASPKISPEEIAAYQTTARRRQERKQLLLVRRQDKAWDLARRAAALLKTENEVHRVVLYGSLARGDFHEHSDIDLMVWGLDEQEYYRTVAELLALDATLEVDLAMAEHASPALLAAVEQEGVPL